MSAYQIGQLVGLVTVAIIGGALTRKLFKSSRRWQRIAAVPVAILFAAYILVKVVGAFGSAREDFKAGFINGCVKKCATAPALKTGCQSTCVCQYDKIAAREDIDELVKALKDVRSEADLTPEMQARLRFGVEECMTPELYDQTFLSACNGVCEDDACKDRCSCILREVRKGMEPKAGTVWLMNNLEQEPVTPEGTARMDVAIEACTEPDTE